MDEHIPIDKCIDGHVYIIDARNASVGIFEKNHPFWPNAFIISRNKFNANYLFPEFHWDNGAPYGTAKPYKDTGIIAPEFETDDEKLKWLNTVVADLERNNVK